MSSALVYTGNYFNNESQFESAFDEFDLRGCVSDDSILYLPKQLIYSVAQTKTSRFVECDKEMAKFYEENYSNVSVISDDMKNDFRNGVQAMKSMMNEELKQFWISFGTLLGWYRQCGIFSYVNDIDFTTWSKYASEEFTNRVKTNKEGIKMWAIFGFFDEAYEISLIWNSTKFDLFFNYIFGDRYAVAGHFGESYKYYYNYKYFLCSADFLGIRVNVPCDPKRIIINEYGPDWGKPIENWNYVENPFSKGDTVHWSDDRKNRSFIRFYD